MEGLYRKRQKLIVTLFTLVLICLFGLTRPAYAQEQQDKVLILNSYHSNLNWTNNIVMSVLDEFKKSQLDLMVYTEYMDWKNHPQDQHIDNLYRTYKEKYQQNKIDMIITTDDKALEFALKYREEIFSNAPIVFAGTNEEGEQELIRDHKNLTGVIEHIDLEETIDMALRINPEMKKFYIIYDQTESGKSTYSIVNNIIKSKYKSIKPISITNKSHAHVLAAVNELEEDSAILITNYYSDINGKVIADEEFCKIISDTVKVPVFHMYGLTMGHGNIGGSMICAHRQGESAGQLATKILKGKKADELPIIRNTPMKLAFDYEQLQRFDIPMKLVPKEAEIINQPFSFFRAYKELVISWLVILCLLVDRKSVV